MTWLQRYQLRRPVRSALSLPPVLAIGLVPLVAPLVRRDPRAVVHHADDESVSFRVHVQLHQPCFNTRLAILEKGAAHRSFIVWMSEDTK